MSASVKSPPPLLSFSLPYYNTFHLAGRLAKAVTPPKEGHLRKDLRITFPHDDQRTVHDVTSISASGRGAEANGPIEAVCAPAEGGGERADEQYRELGVHVHVGLRHWRSNCLPPFYSLRIVDRARTRHFYLSHRHTSHHALGADARNERQIVSTTRSGQRWQLAKATRGKWWHIWSYTISCVSSYTFTYMTPYMTIYNGIYGLIIQY